MMSAQKFFSWLRDNPTQRIRGRVFLASDIDEAEKRCRQVWGKSSDQATEELQAKAGDDDKQKSQESQENLSNAEMITQQVLKKASDMSKAERYFEMLHRTVGQKNSLGESSPKQMLAKHG